MTAFKAADEKELAQKSKVRNLLGQGLSPWILLI